MKKILILLLTLVMILSLCIVSCSPDATKSSQSQNQDVADEENQDVADEENQDVIEEEKAFTEDIYKEISEANNEVINKSFGDLKNIFSGNNPDAMPSKISGSVKLSSDKGFSLLLESDFGTEGTPNNYEYIELEVAYDNTKSTSNTGSTDGSEGNVPFNLTIKYKLIGAEGEGTTIKISDVTSGTSDTLAKELSMLVAKAMKSGEGGGPSLDLNAEDYLAQIITLGNASPKLSLSFSLTPAGEESSITVAMENATVGGDVEKNILTFGGKISVKKDTEVIASLAANVSVTFGNGFNISVSQNKGSKMQEPKMTGTIAVKVSDIELIIGKISITGDVDVAIDFDKYNATINGAFKEKMGDENFIDAAFNIVCGTDTENIWDIIEFSKFKYKGVSYSSESVRDVFKKAIAEKKEK